MSLKSRSLSNSESYDSHMQVQITEDILTKFLERKFRTSRSYGTKSTYRVMIHRFAEFVRQEYNLELNQLFTTLEAKSKDSLDVLDDYYTFLSKHPRSGGKIGYANSTILQYVITAKEFLNSQGCKIYTEDLRQKFRLPKVRQVYEKGLTKEILNRLIRFANPKLATAILVASSSGMRIGEVIQLKLSDIDFTKTPTTIVIRSETTKTRETRVTHLSSEATNSLKDLLVKQSPQKENDDYIFLIPGDSKTEESLAHYVKMSCQNLGRQLSRLVQSIPELDTRNENGRNAIHFHAFRAWFKTQVTDAHQSDFAEALMGHKSLKLVYYRQNEKAHAKTYLEVEHSLTISDTEKIDQNYTEIQKDNLELRGIVDSLSKQLRNLEKRIEEN